MRTLKISIALACSLTAFTAMAAETAVSDERPNIIVIKTDDQRWDSLGCYGDTVVKTPHIDALSKEGTRLENAFTVAVLCTPSRTSFFTGQYASRNKRFDNTPKSEIGVGQFSYIETLKNAGYQIGLSGKNHTFHTKYAEKMFDTFEEYSPWGKTSGTLTDSDKALAKYRSTSGPPSSQGRKLLEGLIDHPEPFPEAQCMETRIAEDAVAFVDKSGKKPFFLLMSFPSPHWPNVVCEPYFSMYKKRLKQIKLDGMDEMDWEKHPFAHFVQSQVTGFDTMSKEDRRKILAVMYGQITFIDKSVGQLVAALKQRGLYDNTIIVFTSDQGCFGGQFGLPCKTKGFYESLIRVPLVFKMPGDKSLGKTIAAQVCNIDVMPTILEAAGVSCQESVDGKSFLSVLQGKTRSHRDVIYSEVGSPGMPPQPIPVSEYASYNKMRSAKDMFWFVEYTTKGRCAMIREEGWKYCFYNGDLEELYHYEADPLELNNLATAPSQLARKEAMKKKLFKQGFVDIK